jgi:DNA polymerase
MERKPSGHAIATPDSTLPILGPADPTWRSLTRTIRACTKCHLAATRTRAVAYRGATHPWVVFVGEAPGVEEDRQGLPFVGRGGRVLDRAIADAGLDDQEYGIVNVLKCRPALNRFDPAAAAVCRHYLDRQLELLRPRALVSLGRTALRALDPLAPPMLQSAGSPRSWGGHPLFPMIHPAATFRSRRMGARWRTDTAKLSAWLARVRPARP